MTVYAFDWGGTLNENPELMEVAKVLLEAGHEVHIISVAWARDNRAERLANHPIPFTKVHVIIETGSTQHGVEKVKIMKDIGCRIIFDDNADVIKHAKAAGFVALKVPYKDH
jgi:hypothetical protein